MNTEFDFSLGVYMDDELNWNRYDPSNQVEVDLLEEAGYNYITVNFIDWNSPYRRHYFYNLECQNIAPSDLENGLEAVSELVAEYR
jgi:hypothetical protein